jgi:transcriptional regulator of acetoin/glycerol metabolism
MHALQRADWPHNWRQLDATVHRLLIEADGAHVITLTLCADDLAYLRGKQARTTALTEAEIASALARGGGPAKAAILLGVDRVTLYRRRKRARLERQVPPEMG